MKRFFSVMIAVVIAVAGSTAVFNFNLVPEAEIVVGAIAPQEAHDDHLSYTTTGLSVVGNEQVVLLIANDTEGEEVLTATWTLVGPAGSVATMDSSGTVGNTFRPDMTGKYTVTVDITTASGASSATKVITAAEFVGVGNIGGATPDTGAGQCAMCHSGNTAQWAMTGHSDMFSLAIDGLKSSHYGENCIGCHTLGFDESAANGGFDDVAAALGWTFPDTLVDGNWQTILDDFPALAQVSNIQCESCHGPGSMHKGDASGIEVSLNEGVCGQCHEEETHHTRNIEWKFSAHATGASIARGTSASCAPCHSGWGFVARMDPASDLEMTTGAEPISCAVCHDPHDATNAHQLRMGTGITLASGPTVTFGGNGQTCMNCHKDRRVGGGEEYVKNPTSTFRGPHHSNQTDMLAGASEAVITFGQVLPNSTHKDVVEGACVGCHMASNDKRDLGDHSWKMSTTEIVGTDTLTVDNIAACQDCHGAELESFDDIMARADHDGDGDIEAATAEVEGLLHDIAMMLPPFDTATVDIRAPIWNTEGSLLLRKAAWNYFWVDYDHSHGVHNYQFSVALLKLTMDVLENGVLSEGVIAGVMDVPDDQGKQAAVSWTRFGGDGASDTPLQTYYVWLKVDMASMGKAGPTFDGFEEVPGDASLVQPGMTVQKGHELYSQVASHVAAGQEMYVAVAPTLFNATPTDTVWSVFRVSGHAADAQKFVVSEPDSGYSVDNLAPGMPMNLAAYSKDGTVYLTWDEVDDEDFNSFAIYRGDNPGFDVDAADPIGIRTVGLFRDQNVDLGTSYVYRIAAFDFNGNRGDLSDEITQVAQVGVEGEPGVPTVFELRQNYPNPFNPATRIDFAVPEASDVTLTVMDVSGKVVKVLADGHKQPGRYTVTWSADGLASGTYFYRMHTAKFSEVRTMILVK